MSVLVRHIFQAEVKHMFFAVAFAESEDEYAETSTSCAFLALSLLKTNMPAC